MTGRKIIKEGDWWTAHELLWDACFGEVVNEHGDEVSDLEGNKIVAYTLIDALVVLLAGLTKPETGYDVAARCLIDEDDRSHCVYFLPDLEETFENISTIEENVHKIHKWEDQEREYTQFKEFFWDFLFPQLNNSQLSGLHGLCGTPSVGVGIPPGAKIQFYEKLDNEWEAENL